MAASWERVKLGPLETPVAPLGIGSSYGVGAAGVRRAFDRGVNLFYWGTMRRRSFGEGIADLATTHRDEMLVVVQTYSRMGSLVRPSLRSALKKLRIAHADVLLLGMWNRRVPGRVMDAAQACVDEGLARHVMVSCHRRATFAEHAKDERIAAIMVRYNAAHPGAEEDVFPLLPARPLGVVAYTATCWGRLLDETLIPADVPVPRGSDCYRYALTHPRVDAVLCGPRGGRELDEAMRALDRGPMSPDELAWMKRVGAAVK